MNQAQSHRRRMRYLLLLAPLLVAATPAPRPLVLLGQLVIEDAPSEVHTGECIPLTVKAQNLLGSSLNLGTNILVTLSQQSQSLGTFHRLDGCQSETTAMTIPAGANSVPVWFKPLAGGRVTLVASDGLQLGLNPGTSPTITVLPGLATQLKFTTAPIKVRPGMNVDVTVTAYVSYPNEVATTYGGRVRLSSTPPIPGLPQDGMFDPVGGNGQKSFTVAFREPGNYQLILEDIDNPNLKAFSPTITVLEPKVAVTANRKLSGTCQTTTFTLSIVNDEPTLPPPPSVFVSLCRPDVASVLPGAHSFGVNVQDECISGTLTGTRPETVDWSSADPVDDATFVLMGAQPVGDLTVAWKKVLSPQLSSLSFPNNSVPTLPNYNQQLPVRLELKDTCDKPIDLPEKSVGFAATSPLIVTSLAHPEFGVWTAKVGLAACPDDRSKPLFLQPTFDGATVLRGPGEPFQERIQPDCPAPLIHLSLRSKEESTLTMPGHVVRFEVKLENTGTEPISNGVLKLSPAALTLVEAEVDGAALTLQDNTGVLPTLEPTKTLTVKLTAQVASQPEPPVSLTAGYTTQDGAPLTPSETVTLGIATPEDLGVNVGCGSQAASLPSHFVTWLVLLLAASRPWERSRRLRRLERIDR